MNSLFFRLDEHAVLPAQLLPADPDSPKLDCLGHAQLTALQFYVLTLAEVQKLDEHLLQLLDVPGCEQQIVHIFMDLLKALVSHTSISNQIEINQMPKLFLERGSCIDGVHMERFQ